jgi:hypothetical protein
MGWTFISFTFARSMKNALPLIVTHGWPGSVVEQLKIVDPLDQSHGTWRERFGRFPSGDPVDPGLRFSAKPTTTGWGPDRSRAPGSC